MPGQHSPPNSAAVDTGLTQPTAASPGHTPSVNGVRAAQRTPIPVPAVLAGGQGLTAQAGAHIARLAPHSPSSHILSPSLAAAQTNVRTHTRRRCGRRNLRSRCHRPRCSHGSSWVGQARRGTDGHDLLWTMVLYYSPYSVLLCSTLPR